ncbi:hypothetical protein [Methanofollis formosanus]|uniref:hypothetical protein n=1 Tax=Methanofollis formosanus TaxID=299308 RepID=UPI001C7D8ED8|nr:hypothetical protein [Methanofollis formosanus]
METCTMKFSSRMLEPGVHAEFYIEVLGQEIKIDMGANVEFVGGLALWEWRYMNNLLF